MFGDEKNAAERINTGRYLFVAIPCLPFRKYFTLKKMKKHYLFCLVLTCVVGFSFAQKSNYISNVPGANGPVNAITSHGDTVFVGGDFTTLFSRLDSVNRAKYSALIDSTTGLANAAYPKPNSTVYTAIPDGHNGYYIGGAFTKVGNAFRSRVAHIDSTGNVTGKFSKAGIIGGAVRSLALKGDTLFVGGYFTGAGKVVNGAAFAVDAAYATYPLPEIDRGTVYCALSDDKGGWYIGGTFSMVGDSSRWGLAHIDSAGNVTAWDPHVFGPVYTIYKQGDVIYLGGSFTQVGGFPRNNLAAVSATSGDILNWVNNCNGTVNAISGDNSQLIIAGGFSTIGGLARQRLAAIDMSGSITGLMFSMNGSVLCTKVKNGILYLGGSFTNIGGQSRSRLAAINLSSGTITGWNPSANDIVRAIDCVDTILYVGGDFTTVSNESRGRLCAISMLNASVTSWNPGADAPVYALSVMDSMVYAGGDFTIIGGQSIQSAVAINLTTGIVSSFNPRLIYTTYALASSGSRMLIGGAFYSGGGQARGGLVALSISGDSLLTWNSGIAKQHTVHALCITDSILLIGGAFHVNSRTNLAAIQKNTLASLPWGPVPNGPVYALAARNDSIFVGGAFSLISSSGLTGLACFKWPSSSASSWNANITDGRVHALCLTADKIYIGGDIATINSQTRNNLGAINLSSASLSSWNPDANGVVNALSVYGGAVYAGGNFTKIGGQLRNRIAKIDLSTAAISSWDAVASHTINVIHAGNNGVYAGGDFASMGGKNRYYIAAFSESTGNILDWAPQANDQVHCFKYTGATLYAGGNFTTMSGQTRNRVASFNVTTGAMKSFNPGADAVVRTIDVWDNKVYMGGDFNNAGGQGRTRLVEVDSATGNATALNISFNGTVYALAASANMLFAGGNFTFVAGQTRSFFVAIDRGNSSLSSSFANILNGQVRSMFVKDSVLFLGGMFSNINGPVRIGVGAVHMTTGALTAWNPNSTLGSNPGTWAVTSITPYADRLFYSNLTSVYPYSISEVDFFTGYHFPWIAKTVSSKDIYALHANKKVLYAGGAFVNITGVNVSRSDPAYFIGHDIDTNLRIVGSVVQSICQNHELSVPFFKNSNTTNTFVIQLSDSSGSFANPLNIGSTTGARYGFITGRVPRNIPAGVNYRIRLAGLNPAIYSAPSPNNIIIKVNAYTGFSISDTDQCLSGNVFSLNDTSVLASGYSMLRLWRFGDGTEGLIKTPAKVYATNDTFTVILSQLVNNGCRDSFSRQVVVFPEPVPGYTINDSTQCFRDNNFVFADTSRIASGNIASRTWNFGAGTNDTSDAISYNKNYTADGNFMVKLKVTSNKGCIDSIIKPVTVYLHPRAGFIVSSVSNCSGDSFFLSDTSQISSGTLSRTWNFGAGPNDTLSLSSVSKSYTVAGLYTVQLVAKSNFDCTDTATTTLVVNPVPVARMVVNNPAQCYSGNTFLFTDSSAITYGNLTVLWNFGEGINDTSSQSIFSKNYSTPGIYIAKLVVRSGANCVDSAITNVTVHPSPLASFFVNDTTQCLNTNSFAFTDSSSISSGNLMRVWNFGSGSGDTSLLSNPVKSYTLPGAYLIRLISISDSGCTDTVLKGVVVYHAPNAGFRITTSSAQCWSTNSFTVQDTSVIVQGTLNTKWNFGSSVSDTSSQTQAQKTYTVHGNYPITLIAESNLGCKDTAVKMVEVYPQANIQFTVNDSQQCLKGNKFVFSNQSSVASGTFSSYWTFGDSAASSSPNVQHSYNNTGSYNVWLRTITNNGCVDSLYRQVSLFGHPAASFTCADTQQCLNGNVFAFTNTSVSSVSYLWNFGNSATTVQMSPQYTYANSGVFDVRLISYDSNGCTDTTGRKIYVEAPPAPPQLTVTPDSVVCAGTVVTLRCASTFNKEWFKDSTPLSIFTDSLVLQSSTGYYHVEVRNAANCASGSVPIYILFKSVPVKPNVTASGSLFTSNAPYGNQWYNTAGILSGDTGVTYTASAANVYYSIVTVNGCSSDSSNNITYPATGVVRPEQSMQVLVYPNPNNGDFTLACNSCPSSGSYNILLTDYCGKQLLRESVADLSSVRIRNSGLAAGLYLLSVTGAEGTARIPVFIR